MKHSNLLRSNFSKKEININLIYDTQSKLRKFHIYNDDDIQTVMKLNRQAKQKQNNQLLGRLSSVLRPLLVDTMIFRKMFNTISELH